MNVNSPAHYHQWAAEHPWTATGLETVGVLAAKYALSSACKRAGLNVRNALEQDHLEAASRHMVGTAIHAVIAAPLFEETLQHQAPLWLYHRLRGHEAPPTFRLATVLGFAAGHAGLVHPARPWNRPPFVRVGAKETSLPIVPLLGGLHYERLSHQRGPRHALAAHMLNNSLECLLALPKVWRLQNAHAAGRSK